MNKFYVNVWFWWALRVSLNSIALAFVLAGFVTFFIYVNRDMPELNAEVIKALSLVFKFWFMIIWNFTLLLVLFRSIKYIFNKCRSGYKFELLSCEKESSVEVLDEIGYGDLVQVWRRWFMLLIWLTGSLMVIALAFTLLFTSYSSLFEWFSIYVLFGFVLVAGFFSFIILGSRCKRVRVSKC